MTPSNLKGTLSHELANFPHIAPTIMAGAPAPMVSSALNQFMGTPGVFIKGMPIPSWYTPPLKAQESPESSALEFYFLNHAMTLLRARVHPWEQLGPLQEIVQAYKLSLITQSARMFYYLVLICTRESRHDGTHYDSSPYQALVDKYGMSVTTFHKSTKGKGSSGAAQMFRDSPPDSTMGAYASFLSDVFHHGSYSHGYGGKAWGGIADILRDFVLGKLSAEMMLDTAFTLCHNNGPIFNKGMLYTSYGQSIYKILDVQRSGQIPQLIRSSPTLAGNSPSMIAMVNKVLDAFTKFGIESEMGDTVDWHKVEALGSLNKYHTEKAAQDLANGSAKKVQDAKKYVDDFPSAIPKGGETIKSVQIYPGCWVNKVKAKR